MVLAAPIRVDNYRLFLSVSRFGQAGIKDASIVHKPRIELERYPDI
jgi:hypothetical protein